MIAESEVDFMKLLIYSSQRSFVLWFQAAQKLENGKKLAPCPRCSRPSKVDVVLNVGQCTHKNCQYLFCCICHCDVHIGSSCPFLVPFPQSRKRPTCIGSIASKKNLRRLSVLSWDMDLCNDLSLDHVQHFASCSSINASSDLDYYIIFSSTGGNFTASPYVIYIYIYRCPRRNVPDFGRVSLMVKYTDITQNTYVQSLTVTEIKAREVWNFDSCYTLVDCQINIKTDRNMWFLSDMKPLNWTTIKPAHMSFLSLGSKYYTWLMTS
jgi:hypothetical protein